MVKLIKHPLINIKLSRMRNKNTDYRDFKSNLKQLSQFMAYELTKNLKTIYFSKSIDSILKYSKMFF